ncbi:probable G-protein coupled receptor B0563.6 [Haliotis rubra]|uniref:probable G-protein coupled receptor B0563.6 n=1 Tax=Haliotis rubra TaxID=36100 RepID=UPI001EE54B73|nr:probable G-protein coupled receptor B0563.6 [Haliotis rubra]
MNITDLLSNWTESTTEGNLDELLQSKIEPMVDKATRDLVEDVVYCWFLPILTILGTTGNVLSCIVLMIQGLKDSTNIFLFVLTVSDTGNLLTNGIRRVECILGKFDALLGMNYYMVTLPQMKVITIIFSRFTGVITMLISLERCIAVTRPMKVRIWFTTKRVWIMIIALIVVVLTLISPTFFTMQLNWTTHPITKAPMAYVSLTDFYTKNIVVMNWYLSVFLTIMFRFIPVVFIFTTSVTIIIALRKSTAFQKATSSAKDEKLTRVTRMMLTICISYVIFNIPASIHQAFVFLYPEYNLRGSEKNVFYLVSAFGQLAEATNSAWNFVLYFALSEKFASTLKRVLCYSCRNLTIRKSIKRTATSSGGETKETPISATKPSNSENSKL